MVGPARGSHTDISKLGNSNNRKTDPKSVTSVWSCCFRASRMPATTPALLPNTPEYKKAQRQYLKATKNRPANIDQEWTPFRAAEKRFKARFPPPDLSTVLDLACRDESRLQEIEEGVWMGCSNAIECIDISGGNTRAYTVPQVPGAPHNSSTKYIAEP